jgi:hypothetical protein
MRAVFSCLMRIPESGRARVVRLTGDRDESWERYSASPNRCCVLRGMCGGSLYLSTLYSGVDTNYGWRS